MTGDAGPGPPAAGFGAAHGNPTLRLRQAAPAGQVVTVADRAGRAVWRSHPLAAGCDAVRVDVRAGRFIGPGRGWSVLPPGGYLVTAAAAEAPPGAPRRLPEIGRAHV